VVLQRSGCRAALRAGRDLDWEDWLARGDVAPVGPVPVEAGDPFCLLRAPGAEGPQRSVVHVDVDVGVGERTGLRREPREGLPQEAAGETEEATGELDRVVAVERGDERQARALDQRKEEARVRAEVGVQEAGLLAPQEGEGARHLGTGQPAQPVAAVRPGPRGAREPVHRRRERTVEGEALRLQGLPAEDDRPPALRALDLAVDERLGRLQVGADEVGDLHAASSCTLSEGAPRTVLLRRRAAGRRTWRTSSNPAPTGPRR